MNNGVVCSLRMRFECSVYRALSTENKGAQSLEHEINAADKDNLLFIKTHKAIDTFCILNDVVVVSKTFMFNKWKRHLTSNV